MPKTYKVWKVSSVGGDPVLVGEFPTLSVALKERERADRSDLWYAWVDHRPERREKICGYWRHEVADMIRAARATSHGLPWSASVRRFLARVFTVAAATFTFALGLIPGPLRACPYCGYKGNRVFGGRNVHHDSIKCRRCTSIYIKDGPRRDGSGALIP
jgi:hypothetical protein